LRGVVGVIFPAEQWILGRARAQTALDAVENGNPDAQGSEIYAGNNAHGSLLSKTVNAPSEVLEYSDHSDNEYRHQDEA
jgi:hypothetical protein